MSTDTAADGSQKPFWLRPPWIVLFDLMKLHRIRPWDIDLSYLLTALMGEMRKIGNVNFTASGIALLSSATILRMKSELVLDLQEPPKPPVEKPAEFLPPPLQIPYRFEYTSTTIDNLLKVLEETLNEEAFVETQTELIPIPPAPPAVQEIDQFMIDVENKIEKMYQRISQLIKGGEVIPLSKLTLGMKRLESIRAFLMVLFIACRGQIKLWQEEGFGEIYISLPREGSVNDLKAGDKIETS